MRKSRCLRCLEEIDEKYNCHKNMNAILTLETKHFRYPCVWAQDKMMELCEPYERNWYISRYWFYLYDSPIYREGGTSTSLHSALDKFLNGQPPPILLDVVNMLFH